MRFANSIAVFAPLLEIPRPPKRLAASSFEHYRPAAIAEDPSLRVPFDGSVEYDRFKLATDDREVLG